MTSNSTIPETNLVQRSCYSCYPYSEGFQIGLKISGKSVSDVQNPYPEDSLDHYAFSDGVRDGLITSRFHQL